MTSRARLVQEVPTATDAPVVGELRIGETRYCVFGPVSDASPVLRAAWESSSYGRLELGEERFAVFAQRTDGDPAGDTLTRREREIVTLVAQGLLNKQIAANLGISEWTVATYLRRIFLKIGVETRAAMVFRCSSMISSAATDDPAPLAGLPTVKNTEVSVRYNPPVATGAIGKPRGLAR